LSPEEEAREKYEQDMTALALIVLSHSSENLLVPTEESDGVLCFDFTLLASLD
jgi:hypothetical protein